MRRRQIVPCRVLATGWLHSMAALTVARGC